MFTKKARANLKIMFPDSKKLTEEQRNSLCILIGKAFIELRSLSHFKKSEQAHALANAFHSLPFWLGNSDEFSFSHIRKCFIEPYHRRYSKESIYDYLELFDKIERGEIFKP